MKTNKKIRIIALLFITIFALLICVYGIALSDRNINGFVGMAGIVRLHATSNSYVRLTNEPFQLLFLRDDWYNFVWVDWYNSNLLLSQYFNFESIHGCGYACFVGYKEGVRYHVSPRAFTRYFYIITIKA